MNKEIRPKLFFVLTVLIIFVLSLFIFFLYFVNKDIQIRLFGTIAIVLVVGVWLVFEYKYRKVQVIQMPYTSNITKFVLMTRDGERDREWHCTGAKSFLIGKSDSKNEVDIDLSDTAYSEYISTQHAVLNYSDGYWYIEDLESLNGVGLKKKGEEYVLKLKPSRAYKLDEGDTIYISKVKLYIR